MRKVMVLWLASLVLVAMTTLAVAQRRFAEPRILSGTDVGFRVEGLDVSGRPFGTVMVRISGDWLEVGPGLGVHPAK